MENYSYFLLKLFVFNRLVFILAHRSMIFDPTHITSHFVAAPTVSFTTTTTTPQPAG